jgi:hypothetical protein
VDVLQVYKGIRGYTRVYKGIHRYTRVYAGIHRYTNKGMCRYTSKYKGKHDYITVPFWNVKGPIKLQKDDCRAGFIGKQHFNPKTFTLTLPDTSTCTTQSSTELNARSIDQQPTKVNTHDICL